MSPRTADPSVRRALLERAATLLVERRPVTLRQLAGDVGVSTMAIYTHFGSMDQLLREVRLEAFDRLGEDLARIDRTDDPVADLLALGWAYCRNAVAHPDLYRVMFVEPVAEPDSDAFGASVFLHVVTAVERCHRSGRLLEGTPLDVGIQLWGVSHGLVSFALRGVLTVDDLVDQLAGAVLALLVGYGDEREAAARSVTTLRRRMKTEQPITGSLASGKQTIGESVAALTIHSTDM